MLMKCGIGEGSPRQKGTRSRDTRECFDALNNGTARHARRFQGQGKFVAEFCIVTVAVPGKVRDTRFSLPRALDYTLECYP